MIYTLLSLLLLSSAAKAIPSRIVNGTDADLGEIPYIVSVKLGITSIHFCGGAILNEVWILTAAHCVYNLKNYTTFKIQYGVTHISGDGLNTIPVDEVIVHKDYQPSTEWNDIALLRLREPLVFGEYARSVSLPPAFNSTPEGADAVLAGWGSTQTGGIFVKDLQRVDIKIYADDDCETLHAETGPTDRKYNLCAGVEGGGKGQCIGDSGGPLVVNGVQVGIVSWSVKPCTVPPFPGVFTKVSSYVDWMYENIREK